ncbi:MAG TPA: hypothetical protein GXZ35_06385 [Acholeplasmataceae bacterium]|jgi:dsRNA-specific ribonuclease|nr:hypothetical protein [Acholeplasmataceae bacterium]
MEKKRIESEMRELEIKIHYHFNDISWLAKAMGSIKIPVPGQGKNGSEYSNEGLATVGDTILKSVIADKFYREGIRTKGEITIKKSGIEDNETMHDVMINEINNNHLDVNIKHLQFYKTGDVLIFLNLFSFFLNPLVNLNSKTPLHLI